MMTPIPFDIGKPLAFAPKAGALQVRAVIDTRATADTSNDSGDGGLQRGTAILIVAGVVCFLILLIGFWLVARPRVPLNNIAANAPVPHSTRNTHRVARPRREPDWSERLKIHVSPRTTSPSMYIPRNNSELTSHGSSALVAHHTTLHPVTATASSFTMAGSATLNGVGGNCPIEFTDTRLTSQSRIATSLSAHAPSLANSHTTEETLNNFRASGYDLDTELKLGMLSAVQDDVSHCRAVEVGCVSMEGTVEEVEGTAMRVVEGGAGTTNGLDAGVRREKGAYEGFGANVRGADSAPEWTVMGGSGSIEVDKVAMGRQVLL
ncbi:hypothetical protein PAXRUDRAFT_694512 [Paxillus rubicundulus Ve08.2h10]|uniref:Uncharacterized protein n=1 Tax=Paxillus rubicundulus Ve08.2h10 TaxID=930991 RepID=A0A0D0CS29_9AGAM|nr:hypothetical protein PAXRUDRAFT_694512 [Paxillus rubicundulus Ve08.2h10]